MNIETRDAKRVMQSCKVGVGGKDALDKAHGIMADCYGIIGGLLIERERLRAWLAKDTSCPCCQEEEACELGCTFADDAPGDAATMQDARAVLRGPV